MSPPEEEKALFEKARSAFEEFLRQRKEGESVNFEAFCRENPILTGALEALAEHRQEADFRLLELVLTSAEIPGDTLASLWGAPPGGPGQPASKKDSVISGGSTREAEKSRHAERFFRSGESGRWRAELPEEVVERICARHERVMKRFGYLP